MNNNYNIKISCGRLFTDSVSSLLNGQLTFDKEFSVSGDINMDEVQEMAIATAMSVFNDKLDTSKDAGKPQMEDPVANAFVYKDNDLESAVSILMEEQEPDIDIYNKEQLAGTIDYINGKLDLPSSHIQ